MIKTLALLISILGAGCVSNAAIITNADNNSRSFCAAKGFGIIGSIYADSVYKECVAKAKAAGHKIEELQ